MRKLLEYFYWKTNLKSNWENFEYNKRIEINPDTAEIKFKPNWYKYLNISAQLFDSIIGKCLPLRIYSFLYTHYLTFLRFFDKHPVLNKGFVNYPITHII